MIQLPVVSPVSFIMPLATATTATTASTSGMITSHTLESVHSEHSAPALIVSSSVCAVSTTMIPSLPSTSQVELIEPQDDLPMQLAPVSSIIESSQSIFPRFQRAVNDYSIRLPDSWRDQINPDQLV